MLVTATADVDKSDKSYYGVSHLYVLSAQGDNFQVPLDKEGPLHAVQWNPTGREFCVCYGFMPSKVRSLGWKTSHVVVLRGSQDASIPCRILLEPRAP